MIRPMQVKMICVNGVSSETLVTCAAVEAVEDAALSIMGTRLRGLGFCLVASLSFSGTSLELLFDQPVASPEQLDLTAVTSVPASYHRSFSGLCLSPMV